MYVLYVCTRFFHFLTVSKEHGYLVGVGVPRILPFQLSGFSRHVLGAGVSVRTDQQKWIDG